jgi:hypothetical protein
MRGLLTSRPILTLVSLQLGGLSGRQAALIQLVCSLENIRIQDPGLPAVQEHRFHTR